MAERVETPRCADCGRELDITTHYVVSEAKGDVPLCPTHYWTRTQAADK